MIKQAWIVFEIYVGAAFVMKTVIENRKRLKIRSAQRMKWFRSACRCIGKMRKLLVAAKKRCSMRVRPMQKLTRMVKYCKKWLLVIRKIHSERLITVCESILDASAMMAVMALWKFKFIKTQRWLRTTLIYRKLLYTDLIDLWNEKEKEIFFRAKKKNNQPISPIKTELIPEFKKNQYIRDKVKEITKNYSIMVHNYHISVKLFEESFPSFLCTQKEDRELRPMRPKVPNLRKMFKKSEMLKEMVNKAFAERASWRPKKN